MDPIANTAKTVASPGVANTIKKPIANVPIGVWAAVIAGSLAFAYFRSKKTSATTNTDATNPPSALVYTGVGGAGTDADNTKPTNGTTFQTNEAWAQAAKNYLIGQGVDAKEASDAVDLYVQGQALNGKQNAMISTAIRAIGSPPQTLPPTTGSPNPTNPDPVGTGDVWGSTPRPKNNNNGIIGKTYTVQDGDTLVSIARKAYGLSPTDYSSQAHISNEILNTNHEKITDVTKLAAGTQLWIPVIDGQSLPGFGSKIPQFGLKGPGPFDNSTGEWQIDYGYIPESANASRTGPASAG